MKIDTKTFEVTINGITLPKCYIVEDGIVIRPAEYSMPMHRVTLEFLVHEIEITPAS